MHDCKPCVTPITPSSKLSKHIGTPLDNGKIYRQIIRALQYATITRPDIAYSVNKLCQYMHIPTDLHWKALKWLLRYIQGTKTSSLFYSHNSTPTLHCYTNSDWGGDINDRRSTSGYDIYLGTSLISWLAKKQPTIARSSTESEYKAIANATSELIWLKGLLQELQHLVHQATLCCNNIGAIYLSSNPVFHARTKYIELDYHFLREQVAFGFLNIKFINTSDQLTDLFTKPLTTARFQLLYTHLHLRTGQRFAGG